MDQVDIRLNKITELVKKFMKELLALANEFDHEEKSNDAYRVDLSKKSKTQNGK